MANTTRSRQSGRGGARGRAGAPPAPIAPVGAALRPLISALPRERPQPRRCDRCGALIEPVPVPDPLHPDEARWVQPARCRCEVEEWRAEQERVRGDADPDAVAAFLPLIRREGDSELVTLPPGGTAQVLGGRRRRALPADKLGPRFAGALLANFEPVPGTEEPLERVREYLAAWEAGPRVERADGTVEGVTHGLYFGSSMAGVGKTRLAATLVNELAVRFDVRAEVWIVAELFEEARARIDSRDFDAFIAGVRNAEHLLLDDLGAQNLTDWGYEQLFMLIDHRYRRCLPTHVTSNFRLAELGEMKLGRVASRLRGMTRGVSFEGASDYRKLENRSLRDAPARRAR